MISENEWLIWRKSPVTEWLWDRINSRREELKEQWAQGQFLSDQQVNIENSVRADVYDDITDAEYRDWLDDDETEIFDKRKELENEQS